MKFPKVFSHLLILSTLFVLGGLLRSVTVQAQSPESSIYLPLVTNQSGQQPTIPTETPQWTYGFIARNQIWQNRTEIPVCWVNPTTTDSNERQWVQQKIHDTWEDHSNIRFVGWGQCPERNDESQIRIQIADTGPHVKTLGQAIRRHNEGMVLNFTFQNWSKDSCASPASQRRACIEVIAVHEFGHALAFAHEQNRPDTPEWCKGQEQGENGDIVVGQWDVNSVMNYCNLNWNNNGVLSDGDIVTLQTFYGVPPTPTPTITPTPKPADTSTPTPTPVIRNWSISGEMIIRDDENWPESDEHGTHVFADQRLLTSSQTVQTYTEKRCTGDEVRGEIQLQLQLEAIDQIRVTGTLLYFEGTSCSTNDLHRTQDIIYLLRPGETQFVEIFLGDGAGDVRFRFSISNQQSGYTPAPEVGVDYNLVAQHSGKCLDLAAEQWNENGGKVQQWDCVGGGWTNQLWRFQPYGNAYQIIAPNGACLDLAAETWDLNGGKVQQWDCIGDGWTNQLWRLQPVGDNLYQIIASSGKCLDVREVSLDNGAVVQQWDCIGLQQTNQLWSLHR